MLIKIILYILSIFIIFIDKSYANEKIYIKDIYINGIQNLDKNIILKKTNKYKNNYIDNIEINKLINDIYLTNFFKKINIYLKNNILIIKLKENYIINNINFNKNKLLDNKCIKKILEKNNLIINKYFNENNLFKFKLEAINLYNDEGKYNIDIDFKIENEVNNKIDIIINFNEGDFTRIKELNIIGNKNIKKKKLLKLMNINNFFLIKKYSIYKRKEFIKDLNKLQIFFKNIGYLNFSIEKLNINLNKNMSYAYIDLMINEGNKFLIKNYYIDGNFDKSYLKNINDICNIKKNETYNYFKLNRIKNDIRNFFIGKGYKDPEVNIKILLNKKYNNFVILNFNINSKNKLMVRKINICGNKYTSDRVIRNEISQMEFSELNINKIKEDLKRLNKLNYFKKINILMKKVNSLNDDNLIDLVYLVNESNFNRFNIGTNIKSRSLNFSFNINQINLFGTGNSIFLKINYDRFKNHFFVGISNPFYITDKNRKVSSSFLKRSFIISDDLNKIYIKNLEISNAVYFPIKKNCYTKYEIKISRNNLMNFVLNKNTMNFFLDNDLIEKRPLKDYFLVKNNSVYPISLKYNDFFISTKFNFNNLNNMCLPSNGIYLNFLINKSIPISYNKFYKICFKFDNYLNKNKNRNFILNNKVQFFIINSLNDKSIPYYEHLNINNNFHRIRGFCSNYMSNKHNSKLIYNDDNSKLIKVNKSNSQLILVNELIFSDLYIKDKLLNNLQASFFLDMSLNLYLGKYNIEKDKNFNIKNIRHEHISTGVNFKWLSPVGLISLSYSIPVLKCNNEITEGFQCNLSS